MRSKESCGTELELVAGIEISKRSWSFIPAGWNNKCRRAELIIKLTHLVSNNILVSAHETIHKLAKRNDQQILAIQRAEKFTSGSCLIKNPKT